MLENVSKVITRNQMIKLRSQLVDLVAEFRVGENSEILQIKAGEIKLIENNSRQPDFSLAASQQSWDELVKSHPAVGFQSLAGMVETGHLIVEGERLQFTRHLMLLETIVEALRPNESAPPLASLPEPVFDDIVGRYVNFNVAGRPCRVYFEEAGQGTPLLCLHTAGSDGRQYRDVLRDPRITKNHRVIVFDLPWHGKSSPPEGFENEPYSLTTDVYVDTVMAFKSAIGLDNPIIMGCSIGGRAVLHLSLRHGKQFKAAIGLQSALYAHSESASDENQDFALYRPDVHGSEVAGAQMISLIAPQSPPAHKWETVWHYMQGGPGVFLGDLYYYFVDGDLRNGLAKDLDTEKCPLYLLTGEYDLSATPEMTKELAREVGATHFEVMKNMGHFPMSENPEEFKSYLLPVLDKIQLQKEAA